VRVGDGGEGLVEINEKCDLNPESQKSRQKNGWAHDRAGVGTSTLRDLSNTILTKKQKIVNSIKFYSQSFTTINNKQATD
jgi:hypothetical protein